MKRHTSKRQDSCFQIHYTVEGKTIALGVFILKTEKQGISDDLMGLAVLVTVRLVAPTGLLMHR